MNGATAERATPVTVSVIVLTYNHARYIRQALDSILAQETDFPYEILVGDDASTDGTQAILREYARREPDRLRLFLHEKNMGASRNAYTLLMAARGKYLATCEGDDYWCDREKLRIQVAYLEAHPAFSGCVHPCRIVDEWGRTRRDQRLEWVRQKPVFTLRDFQGIYLPGQYATFVRRNLFLDKTRDMSIVYQAHPMVADRTTMMLYLLAGDIACIDRVMSCYRKVTRKDGVNLTTVAFRNNRSRVQEEQKLLQSMEAYLSREKGCEIRFRRRRRELFCEAVFQWLRGAGRINLQTAGELWRDGGYAPSYLLALPVQFVRKSGRYIEKRWLLADREGSGEAEKKKGE